MPFARSRLVRQIRARPRLAVATAIAVLVASLLPTSVAQHPATRSLVAWNTGVVLYFVLAVLMMVRSSEDRMQRRARQQDEGQYVVLALVVTAVVASLAAIVGQLAVARDVHGLLKAAHIALAAATVLSSWAFMHLMFALHYAHDYYAAVAQHRKPGLAFPGDGNPDYGDFVYFSAVIGTSGQTADVSLTTRAMRRLGTAHCVLSFFFNTTVLALTVNIAASVL
jgi:uncharacterized membrane protein